MKKRLMVALLSGALITTLFQSFTVGAEEIDWMYLGEYENLLLMEEEAGQKITKVSTEPVDKETVTYGFGKQYSVAISASMDGEEFVELYSSETPYMTKSGEMKYPAVLKADTNHRWTNNSCIILKMEDVIPYIEVIQIDMGASKDGPRDYKIEYSVDEGVTWKAFSENETDKGCITSAGNIVTVFEKKGLLSIDRGYTTKKCVFDIPDRGLYNLEYDFIMYDDIYFKISIDSDYKVDGTQGIIGSDKGEIAIYGIRLFGPCELPADGNVDTDMGEYIDSTTEENQANTEEITEESQPTTEQVTEEKQSNTERATEESQPTTEQVTEEKQPNTEKATETSQLTTEQCTEQQKEKAVQTIKVEKTKKTYTVSRLKKKSRYFVISISASGEPKVSFKKISGSKRLSIQKKTGKVIVKKGTKKGLYKMKVRIKVNETREYRKKTVTKTITVRVK